MPRSREAIEADMAKSNYLDGLVMEVLLDIRDSQAKLVDWMENEDHE